MKVDEFDNTKECINAKEWFDMWLPSGNPVTSTLWRYQIGLNKTRQRDITQRQAFLVAVRSQLKRLCKELKIKKPRDKGLDYFGLEAIGNMWLQWKRPCDWKSAIDSLRPEEPAKGEVPVEQLGEVLEDLGLGKSRRSQRRYLEKAGLPNSLSKGRRLTRSEVRRIAIVVRPLISSRS